jgi:hypothetical protein
MKSKMPTKFIDKSPAIHKNRRFNWHLRAVLFFFLVGIAVAGLSTVGQKSAAAACTAPATTYGTDTMTVSAPSTGTYYVWVRMEDPSTSANSIMLQVDGGTCFTVGGSSSVTANAWTWIDYDSGSTSDVMSTSLTQGTHTIELIGTEAGVSVDRVELLTASPSSCTPTSTGENCAPSNIAPPTVSFTAPTQSSSVSGSSVPITATASSASGVSQVGIAEVVLKLDGTILATDTASPYSTTWNTTTATNGSHTLSAVATDTQGNSTTTTETVTVANSVACAAVPSVPTGLTASSTSSTSVTLTWGAVSAPANCTISKYTVDEGSSTTPIASPTTNSYTVSGLSPSTKYTFSVGDADSVGSSAQSAAYSVTTGAETSAPTAPTGATATASSSTDVKLSWSAATDSVGVSYYRIYRNGTLIASTTAGSGTTSYSDTTAAQSTTYTYTISAVNVGGIEGAKATTSPATVTTPATTNTTVPATPASLNDTLVTSSSAVLTWTESTANVGVSGYKVYRSTGSGSAALISGTSLVTGTSYTDSGLAASTTYKYYVVAYTSSGTASANSSTLSVTTEAGTTSTCSVDAFLTDNNETVVNIFSASILFSHWGATGATCTQGDLDNSGTINIFDASILFSAWGDKV